MVSEMKRVNVVIPEEAHRVLIAFQTKMGYPSKDKALSELLLKVKNEL
jgi:hypothetical protein